MHGSGFRQPLDPTWVAGKFTHGGGDGADDGDGGRRWSGPDLHLASRKESGFPALVPAVVVSSLLSQLPSPSCMLNNESCPIPRGCKADWSVLNSTAMMVAGTEHRREDPQVIEDARKKLAKIIMEQSTGLKTDEGLPPTQPARKRHHFWCGGLPQLCAPLKTFRGTVLEHAHYHRCRLSQ